MRVRGSTGDHPPELDRGDGIATDGGVVESTSTPASSSSWSPSRHERVTLDNNTLAALELPRPFATYTYGEIADDVGMSAFRKFRNMGLIRVFGEREKRVNTYYTDDERHRWIQANLERPSTLPCGHRGVRTLTAGEEYTCTDDDCDQVFGPEAAREVIGA